MIKKVKILKDVKETKTIEVDGFETSDGKQFEYEDFAIKHENQIKIKYMESNLPYHLNYFYLRSKDDLKIAEEIINAEYYKNVEYEPNNFSYPNWYIAFIRTEDMESNSGHSYDEGIDYLNVMTLDNFNKYIFEQINKNIK